MSKINIRFGATPGASDAAMQELSVAREKPDGTTFPSLRGRLDELDSSLAQIAKQLNDFKYAYAYNTDGTVQTITEKDVNNIVLSTTTFTYKTNGDVDTSTKVMDGQTVTTQYVYDSNGNLTDTINTKS